MLGNSASTVDTLKFAAAVVAFFNLKTAPQKAYDYDGRGEVDAGWQRFEELPVDIAMQDGGWKVLEYEFGCTQVDNRDLDDLSFFELRVMYVERHCPAPGDGVQAESLEWLNVSLRPNQLANKLLHEIIIEDWATDNDE